MLTQGYWSQAYASLTLSRNYIYGNTIDEVLGFEWVVNGTPSIWYYYLHDHLYSPAVMLTEYGVVERYEYNAYGRRSVMTPGFAHRSNSHYLSDIGLTGREIDELDLDAAATPRLQHMHYRHRDYSPQLGRFLQHDPLGMTPDNQISNLHNLNRQTDQAFVFFGYLIVLQLEMDVNFYRSPHYESIRNAPNSKYNYNTIFEPSRQFFDGMSIYQYVGSNPISKSDWLGLAETFGGCYAQCFLVAGNMCVRYTGPALKKCIVGVGAACAGICYVATHPPVHLCPPPPPYQPPIIPPGGIPSVDDFWGRFPF